MPSDFETLVSVVHEQLNDPSVAWGVFRVALSQRESPRRVVWIPGEFMCEGLRYSNSIRDPETGERAEALITDKVSVECHIYGRDFEDACEIRKNVLNAANDSLGISSIPRHGTYESESDQHSGYMWGGMSKIIQIFEWQINVPRLPETIVHVIEIDQTSELHASGVTSEELIITAP